MSSNSRLPERPKPPTVDQIMSDIRSTKNDDLIFAFGTPGVSRDSTPVSSADNSFDMAMATEKGDTETEASGKFAESADINTGYLKTLQLLAMTELLKSSSDNLKEQYRQLQQLGVEVTEAIATLKSAAQTVNPKT